MKKIISFFCLCFFISSLSVFSQEGYLQIKTPKNNGYENSLTKELTKDEFADLLFRNINEERSIKGLLPLAYDPIAKIVATEQSAQLIKKGYLSYYNFQNQCPDERYTLQGGNGAIIETVKGFEVKEKIKLTELLIEHLIEALNANKDDSNVLFSPYLTHCACGFSLSSDKKKFVSVLEFLTKGGEFDLIKPVVNLGEKLILSGVVKPPFKFKAVSVAYFDMPNMVDVEENENNDFSFDTENLIPYFPPQDYIAFTDTTKSNFLNVLKGIGIIGAIGASPFTGGASAILAPALLSSIQSGTPREIPLKRGVKVKGNKFSGEVELNFQGMTGLYFVSILGELPNINFPIVISRRTVRVVSPLQYVKPEA